MKGRCPYCGKSMKGYRRIYWSGMKPNALDFRFEIDHCRDHGAFIWRRGKYQLANFSKLQPEATISPLDNEMKERVQWVEYTIVKLKCPCCEEEWEQHREFPPEPWGCVICPNGHQIPRK